MNSRAYVEWLLSIHFASITRRWVLAALRSRRQ